MRQPLWIAAGLVTVTLVAVGSLSIGVIRIDPGTVISIAANRLGFAPPGNWSQAQAEVLLGLRLPRVVLALFVGMGLSCAGAVFQALLRNPLADPYVLGISGGGAIGGMFSMLIGYSAFALTTLSLSFFSFLGSAAAMILVYGIARRAGRLNTETMLLGGVIVNAFCSSIILFVYTILSPHTLQGALFWLMGDLGRNVSYLGLPMALILSGVIYLSCQGRSLNALSLGEETAAQLGVEVERVKRGCFLCASLITGVAVSCAGLIGFVGLMVPHAVRLIMGADHRWLIPTSAIVGAGFLLLCDDIARTVLAPVELPVGVITAGFGAPFFLYLLVRSGRSMGTRQ
jgi:ABC-type Fe3+-siderophore transport system permease subunit